MPPIILEILVDSDRGVVELKQFDKAVQDTTKSVDAGNQTHKEGAQASSVFGSSLAQSAKSATALSLAFAGIAGIGATLGAAASSAASFEAALNAIAALGTVSARQLTTLREQLLALPPALGSSTELAKGLYDILGANVPAENAITVLTRSAELAKGGLGNLDTAINAVTKSAAAFGIPLSEAQYVTDVFTQTVVRGQGRMEEFAQAFPQVAATAAAAGSSFVDTNAAIAVLTQTFKNADTAATGLNSFFQQLIQNSGKLAAEGINVKQVLAEEGLTGLFRRLSEATGGSAERLKELINDSEGFRAALTLTGTQFQTFNETVESYANVAGLAQQAASKNLSGATASWHTFLNTLDRLVQEVAPPLLEAFTRITGVAATLAGDVTKLYRAFAQSEFLQSLIADFKTFFGIIGDTQAVRDLAGAMGELNQSMLTATGSSGEMYNALDVLDQLLKGNVRPAIDFVTAGWDLLNAAFDYTVAGVIKLGQYFVDGLVVPLSQVIAALDQAATALGISDGRFSTLGETAKQLSVDLSQASATFVEMADEYVLGTHRLSTAQERADKDVQVTTKSVQTQGTALKDQGAAASTATHQTTQLSAAQQDLNKAFEDANTAASKLKGTLEKLKLGDVMKAISTVELSNAVGAVMEDLQTMEASGKFSARQIAKAYEDAAAVLRERFGFLPGVFQQAFDRMRAQALNTEDGVVLAFERMGVKIRGDLQQTAREALNDFQAILDSGGAVPRELLDVYLDVLDQIDKAGFQRLPENFQAVNQRMLDVARKAGVDLPQPYVDAFGQIATAGKQAAEAIDLSWLQSRGVLERARGTVEDLAESVVKLSDETQRLMDLQISVETRFASDVPGLLKQYNQAVKELYNLQSNVITMAGGAPGERDFRINQQLEIIKAIIAALAKLGVNELGQALPGTTGGGMGGGGIPTSGGAGSITTGGIPSRTTGIPSASSPYQAVPSAPLGGTSIQSAPLPTSTTQRTYTMYIQTQATDAATLARDLVPYLRQSDLSPRPLGG